MLTFIKLGGSLITDKRQAETFQAERMARAAAEIAAALRQKPGLRILIGHGSGSFGHVAAHRHGTADGVRTAEQWVGFGEVARVARRLNFLVEDALTKAGLPILPIQPSSSLQCADGHIQHLELSPIVAALEHGLIPLVYGDVALDTSRGGAIVSTETLFAYLAVALHPERIMLMGEVEGVYGADGGVIPYITPSNYAEIVQVLGGSHGTDVTGGMASKVQAMLDLSATVPGLEVRIFSGLQPGQIRDALLRESSPGTLITREGKHHSQPLSLSRLRAMASRELSALQQVSHEIATSTDVERLLPLIIDKLTETVEAERGTLFLVDDQRGELYSKVLSETENRLTEIRVKIGQGIAGYVAATGETLNIPDPYNDPRFNQSFDRQSGFRTRSMLTAPMRSPSQKVIGVVQVLNKIGGAFTERDEQLILAMASQAAIGIESARLHAQEIRQRLLEQELRTAQHIQQSFLPERVPTAPGWDIGAAWTPAQDVAGDFYDFQPLGGSRWAFLIADVSGKGVPAALFMALSVTLIRFAITLKFRLADLMGHINHSLIRFNPQSQMFASIFMGELDFETGYMEAASAGHNPPLLWRSAERRAEFVRIPGVIAGMIEGLEYRTQPIQLKPGDVLVLYTDGITEAVDAQNNEFGTDRLQALVAQYAEHSAAQIVRAIMDAVDAHYGAKGAFDDETLVVIKRNPA